MKLDTFFSSSFYRGASFAPPGSLEATRLSHGLSTESDPLQNPYSRLAYPLGDPDPAGANPHANDGTGYRQLSSGQIRTLAEKIVAQIKLRGPFVSLSHFVNRQLVASTAGERGVLEQALLDAETNEEIQARSPLAQTPLSTDGYNAALFAGPAFQEAPGWLTQGDILQALAPVLAPRSDTFVIRAYGELLAATGNPPPLARAYCEAVVQRMPEFLDANNPPETPVTISTSRETIDLQPNPALTAINRELGRKFRIVSFRWLDENDL